MKRGSHGCARQRAVLGVAEPRPATQADLRPRTVRAWRGTVGPPGRAAPTWEVACSWNPTARCPGGHPRLGRPVPAPRLQRLETRPGREVLCALYNKNSKPNRTTTTTPGWKGGGGQDSCSREVCEGRAAGQWVPGPPAKAQPETPTCPSTGQQM